MRHSTVGTLGAVILLLVCGVVVSADGDWDRVFREGNEAYGRKEFETAVEKYSQIADSGVRDGAVEFNLANAHFRAGNLGRAILHYERAARLLPRDRDVRQNLRLARKQTEDLAIGETPNAVVRFFRSMAFSLTANEWAVLLSVSLFSVGGLVAARTVFRGEAARRRLRHAVVVLAVVCVVSAGGIGAHWYRLRQPEAVVLVPEVKLYAEPAPEAGDKHLLMLHEGAKVTILREEDDWVLVRFGPTMRGFCPESSLARI